MPSELETSLNVSVRNKLGRTEISSDSSTSVGMTERLFASLIVYHDVDTRSAALNMAIDEALLEMATIPTIRFYKWNHPALSFGYFGKFDDVANHERDIVRRWTGGGIVFHGEDLTYSIVIPATDAAFGQSSILIYEKVHRAISAAFAANGRSVELVEGRDVALRRPRTAQRAVPTNNCFANPVRADVLSNGRKIAGAAQRRTRRGLNLPIYSRRSFAANTVENDFMTRFCRAPKKLRSENTGRMGGCVNAEVGAIALNRPRAVR